MHAPHRALLTVSMLLTLSAPAFAADTKAIEATEKYWNPLRSGAHILADVPEAEPNNSLATAQLLDCGNTLRPASIGAPADTDYVYFTATAGTIITVGTDADGATGQVGDTRIRLFDASGAVLASDDDSGPGLYSLLTFTATYTGTYYVGFAAYSATASGGYQGFINCAAPQPPPANDQCAGAILLNCGDINISGTTDYATNDYTPLASGTGGCTGYTALGKDVAYLLNVGPGDSLAVSYTSTADGSIYIITDCSSPTTSCVAGKDASLTGQAETLNYKFTAAGLYYLILDNYGTNASGPFTLTGQLICVPPVGTVPRSWGQVKTLYR